MIKKFLSKNLKITLNKKLIRFQMLSCLLKNNFLCEIIISCKKIYLKIKDNFYF
jgi:hypothetical protein